MMIQRKIGEITLNLTDEQYTKLRRKGSNVHNGRQASR
jgi:hypothetical protein